MQIGFVCWAEVAASVGFRGANLVSASIRSLCSHVGLLRLRSAALVRGLCVAALKRTPHRILGDKAWAAVHTVHQQPLDQPVWRPVHQPVWRLLHSAAAPVTRDRDATSELVDFEDGVVVQVPRLRESRDWRRDGERADREHDSF